jgi:ketosteroid isomerase-like protein
MTQESDTGRRSETLALAARFVAALEAGDFDTMRDCYAPDAVIWHNTDGLQSPGQDREANIRVLAWMRRQLKTYRYDVQRREVTSDGFFQQHVLRGETHLGEILALAAVVICRVSEGRITRLDEYLREADAEVLVRAAAAARSNAGA